MKARRKQLKAVLVSGIKKLSPASVALKLGEFPLNFSPFDFSDLDNF